MSNCSAPGAYPQQAARDLARLGSLSIHNGQQRNTTEHYNGDIQRRNATENYNGEIQRRNTTEIYNGDMLRRNILEGNGEMQRRNTKEYTTGSTPECISESPQNPLQSLLQCHFKIHSRDHFRDRLSFEFKSIVRVLCWENLCFYLMLY